MLVLRRKIGEAIILDQTTIIRILTIEDGQVKIGVDAPAEVHILREELELRQPPVVRIPASVKSAVSQ